VLDDAVVDGAAVELCVGVCVCVCVCTTKLETQHYTDASKHIVYPNADAHAPAAPASVVHEAPAVHEFAEFGMHIGRVFKLESKRVSPSGLSI
jgi:hypothetical protein